MKQLLKPGKYVIAVSGGTDSVVLLNMLSKLSKVELVVAHYDHGIRKNSKEDRLFVEELAKKYNLQFEYDEGNLGANTSEEKSREARYTFLQNVKEKTNADAIVTAHHQDDILETIVINIFRGTRRKGLSSLSSTKEIVRPLLNMSKDNILSYAKNNKLNWHEDETNQDEKYLRNWVRKNVIPKLSKYQRDKLIKIYDSAKIINQEIDMVLSGMINTSKLDKSLIFNLSHGEATEIVAHWLRENGVRQFSARQIEIIVIDAKTLRSNKKYHVNKTDRIEFKDKYLELIKE